VNILDVNTFYNRIVNFWNKLQTMLCWLCFHVISYFVWSKITVYILFSHYFHGK